MRPEIFVKCYEVAEVLNSVTLRSLRKLTCLTHASTVCDSPLVIAVLYSLCLTALIDGLLL